MDGPDERTMVDPEELLRGALEKIVFFECRVGQLESELSAAVQAAERARADASAARRREVELARALEEEKGARAEARTGEGELAERVRLLEAERERLLSGLVDRARVEGAPAAGEGGDGEGQADLAGFISELRGEIERLRAARPAEAAGAEGAGSGVPAPPRRSAPEAVGRIAERLRDAGRVGLTARDADRMKDLLPTRSDRVLYERSMEQLGSSDPAERLRAVRSLEALGSKASAPLLAAAVGREPDAAVKAALLGA
ncbi:MAG TPA: PBS lyase, partial [Anaeromyxobacteraceae bacterium]|nr:PBS lyase [Anaeromyxobacteraceae bacterium]